MTTREEIREGIADIIADNEQPDGVDVGRATLQIIQYLHSQGVVVQVGVDEELPSTEGCSSPSDYIRKVGLAGFDVLKIEPLIEE